MKLAVALVLVLAAFAGGTDLELGKPVPEALLGGESLTSLAKAGKVVAVYFWSADCPHGPPNYPKIKAASELFAAEPRVKIFVVSSSGEPEEQGRKWAREAELTSTFVYDEGKKIARHFRPRRVNATFVIDAKGNLIYRGGIADGKSNFLIEAVRAGLEGKIPPASDQTFEGSAIKL